MNILFIADVPLENPVSGSEQVLNQQAVRLSLKGMNVYAITRQNDLPAWESRDVAGVREGAYGIHKQNIVSSALSMIKYPCYLYSHFTKDNSPTVTICHQPYNCFSLLVTRRIQNIPMVYVFHSPNHEEYSLSHGDENNPKRLIQTGLRRLIEKYCLQRSDKIVVLSRYMQHKVESIHRIDPKHIVVNPGGADLKRFNPLENRGISKRELGFPEGKIHLLTIRNLESRMGIDNLLKCIYILRRKAIEVHLTVGGEGEEQKNIENMIVKYGLANDVSMTGFIPPESLPGYYGAADFFILPTRNLEGFGLVTPESMACGTPVLGTPVGGTKEILSSFDEHFLFRDTSPEAMADGIQAAIERYFSPTKKYDSLRTRCREYAEDNYSWERHIDRLESVIEGIT